MSISVDLRNTFKLLTSIASQMNDLQDVVTVVVPCFNNETTIGETIDSVLAQSSSRWELICVDDGSSDGTIKVVKQYCEKDERVKLIVRETEPKGGSHCRNIGAFAAKGAYLIFLDGDDLLSKTCIENRLKIIEGTDLQFAVFRMGFFKGPDPKDGIFAGTQLTKGVDYLYYYASGTPGWTVTSPIIKKSFFISLGGYDISFPRLQDVEYNFRAIIASGGKYKLDYNGAYDCFYRYGSTGSSMLQAKHKMALASYKRFLELVISCAQKGYLQDKSKLSKAFINIYCNAFIQCAIVKIKWRNEQIDSKWLYEKESLVTLNNIDSIYLFLLRKSASCVRLNFYLSRVISKLVRKSF